MNLSDNDIEEFQRLYKNRYNREISKQVAYEQATKLLRLLMLIYKPIALEEYEEIQKYRLEILPSLVNHLASQVRGDSV